MAGLPLHEIFTDTGLDKPSWDFGTSPGLEYTDTEGRSHEFRYTIDLLANLAVLMLESEMSGGFQLKDLFGSETRDLFVRITATPEEHDAMNRDLADFFADPLSYDLREIEMMDDKDTFALARDCEAIRKELYESAGSGSKARTPIGDGNKLLEQCQLWCEQNRL